METEEFDFIKAQLEDEFRLKDKLRDEVIDFERKTRSMVGTLNKIHSTQTADLPALIDSVKPVLLSCRDNTKALAGLVPPNEFWRWKDHWSRPLQSAIFVAGLCEFLSTGNLLTLPQANVTLGIDDEWKDRFHIQVEDYLLALITLINELSRLAVNSVTLGNFEAPFRISSFVKELFAGFSLLNLKNDILRRRFDSIKYDVKKIEEVVYDVSLRKLRKVDPQSPS